MVHPQKQIRDSAFSAFCKPIQKPLSPVCKCLFGFSDPTETKKMLKNTLAIEAQRFNNSWNFDVLKSQSAGDEGKNSGEEMRNSPMLSRPKRFDWQIWNESVPTFYKRQIALNPAKNEDATKKSLKIQKLHENRSHRSSPVPLGRRDENATPDIVTLSPKMVRKPRVCQPTFTSPPKIVSQVLNPAVTRLVTAVRIPPTLTPSQVDDVISPTNITLSTDDVAATTIMTSPVDKSDSKAEVKSSRTSSIKRVASRQLFAAKNTRQAAKRTRMSQPKISDMIPQRKTRNQNNKLNETQQNIGHVTTETQA